MSSISRNLLEALIFFVLLSLSGQIPINVPGLEVPITLQTLIVILIPLRFSYAGSVSGMFLFLALAALGLPLLSGWSGGWEKFEGMSGGYLLGFLVVTLWSPAAKRIAEKRGSIGVFLVFILQHIAVVIFGLLWIFLDHTQDITFDRFVLPYTPGLVLKSVLGVLGYQILGWVQRELARALD